MPFVWPLEIASAMRMNLKRGWLTAQGADALFKRIASLRAALLKHPKNIVTVSYVVETGVVTQVSAAQ